MRLGFRTGGFVGWRTEQILRELRDAGYDGVELCFEHADVRPEEMTPERAEAIQREADDLGIEIASVSYHADGEEPKLRQENRKRIVRLAPCFRTDVFIINSRRTELGREAEQWREFRRELDELVPLAEPHGLRLAVEPEPGMFVAGLTEMERLIEEVASPLLAVNLDIGHAYITDADLSESIRGLGRRIVHLHIEDIARKEHKHLLPGEGDIDFPSVGAALAEIGYTGYHTVDLFPISDSPAEWARKAERATRAAFGSGPGHEKEASRNA